MRIRSLSPSRKTAPVTEGILRGSVGVIDRRAIPFLRAMELISDWTSAVAAWFALDARDKLLKEEMTSGSREWRKAMELLTG